MYEHFYIFLYNYFIKDGLVFSKYMLLVEIIIGEINSFYIFNLHNMFVQKFEVNLVNTIVEINIIFSF